MRKTGLFLLSGVVVSFIFAGVSFAQTWEDYFEKGNQAYQNGNYSRAIKYYEDAVNLNPNSAPIYNALGIASRDNNANMSDIVWFFNVAIDIDPAYYEPYENLCRLYHQAGQYDHAERACLKTLEVNPYDGPAQLSLAWIYLTAKAKPKESVYYFEEILKRVQTPMMYFGLGLAYVQKGDRGKALDMITTLKGQGENELAVRLELAVRASARPAAPPPDPFILPKKQASILVGVTPESSPEPVPSLDQIGDVRVRLRGKMTNIMPPPSKIVEHPASLSDGASQDYQRSNQSAVDRIKKIRKMQPSTASATGTVTSNVSGTAEVTGTASGTGEVVTQP